MAYVEPALRRLERGEPATDVDDGAAEDAEVQRFVTDVMTEARWREVLARVRERLAVGADGFPAYLLRRAPPEVGR